LKVHRHVLVSSKLDIISLNTTSHLSTRTPTEKALKSHKCILLIKGRTAINGLRNSISCKVTANSIDLISHSIVCKLTYVDVMESPSKRVLPSYHTAILTLTILRPFVLTFDLILLLGREVILNVECLANLLGALSLDHVRDCLASNIQQRLDVEVVRG
jgi:hypothetical protein